MIHELQWKLCHLEERFTTSIGYWDNGVFLKQKVCMMNGVTEPRITLIVVEFFFSSVPICSEEVIVSSEVGNFIRYLSAISFPGLID
jgi:hypothetical protein